MNYLKTVFNNYPIFVWTILLVLVTLPLSNGVNSIAIIICTLSAIFTVKKENLKWALPRVFYWPILFYLWMLCSLTWTVDFQMTLTALGKVVPFLIIPLLFGFQGIWKNDFTDFVVQIFVYVMVGFCVFYLLRAGVRFTIHHDTAVFFYHELVGKKTNAIYISVFVAFAYFSLFVKNKITTKDVICMLVLMLVLMLLSSKNIIVVFSLLHMFFVFFKYQKTKKIILSVFLVLGFLIFGIYSFKPIRERFTLEIQTNLQNKTLNKELSVGNHKVYNVSIIEAWEKSSFRQNDFFPGAAFRVLQFRCFLDLMKENSMLFNGLGLNATQENVKLKIKEYNMYSGYGEFNFHNQYLQTFSELGLIGFFLLSIMLIEMFYCSVRSKDFLFFVFIILMISLFLTESYLARQRGVVFFVLVSTMFFTNSKHKILNTTSL